MRQKIIRVGNSAAVTLPKKILQEKGLKIGQEAEIEISPADKQTTLSPEFLNWVDTYIEKNRPALEELAKK
jgi:antitoxin component of MazEF toxin-antitoxin module